MLNRVKYQFCHYIVWVLLVVLEKANAFVPQAVLSRPALTKFGCLLCTTEKHKDYTIADLNGMSSREVILAMRENVQNESFEKVNLLKTEPGINRFIIANPKIFFQKPEISRLYCDSDINQWNQTTTLKSLANILPVIYIAETHPEFGTLGFMLHRFSGKTVESYFPAHKPFRKCKVYEGGTQKRGNSFTMLHKKIGFPENRAFKVLPGKTDFRLFFSPDVAMASELCLTNDAKPSDFKFFEWATVWPPKQLEYEYEKRLWITVEAPTDVIFSDEGNYPMWTRIASSLNI